MIINKLKDIFSRRTMILGVAFLALAAMLVGRLFQLQIVDGQSYADNFTVKTTRTRTIKSTRGNIYDCNGKLLAYNQLSNSVTIQDNESYDTTREKNLSLNGEIYQLTELIQANGDTLYQDFHIRVNDDGEYEFDTENETTLARFRADIYGYQTIDELSEEEASATAADIIDELSSSSRFALVNEDNPYTEEELTEHGLPTSLTYQQVLNIIIVRYQLSLISYQRYVSVTVAKDVSDETVAAVSEYSDELPGVNVEEDYIRVYNNAESMASIIGYTGSPSTEELAELQEENENYSSTSIIGKAGIEQYMETTLQGTDGSEEVTVDNLGRVLAVDEDSRVDPVQGNDVYLTIDSDLQEACYQILEERIAGILITNIQNIKEVDFDSLDDSDSIPIPIYDVYNALLNNAVIDIDHFTEEDASATEQAVRSNLDSTREEVLSWLVSELNNTSATVYNDLTTEQKQYVNYIYYNFLTVNEGVIDSSLVDADDETYQAFAVDGTLSLRDYLLYAANQNWIDLDTLSYDSEYITANEVYQAIITYIQENLADDSDFDLILYNYMLINDVFTPEQVIQILYDQGVLDVNDGSYESFTAGNLTAYDLMISKIYDLEITPAQLALDPCSGSIVITDPDTGEVRACVTYPGYDNNRLANTMDTDYYYSLTVDESSPFYNKATQQLTAPGSTFKPVMAAAGLTEGIINTDSVINCTGTFGVGIVSESDQIRCWYHSGHGYLDVEGAIANSCNVFFCTIGYNLGVDADGDYDESVSLTKIQEYASQFGLDQESGIEISESSPHVTDSLPLPSSIGQGTHQYTTSQLARYASVLANRGTVYSLTLLDKVTDADGNTIQEFEPEVLSTVNYSDTVWDSIQTGMRGVVTNNTHLAGINIQLYGKTGTAEESSVRPNHALMVGFAHSDDSDADDIAYAVRIAYGYSSANAALVVADVMNYYYGLAEEDTILTGHANADDISQTVVTD